VEANEKRIWLFGVFSACPLTNAQLGCQFAEFRKLSALERWEYIEALSEAEVDEYIIHHQTCLYNRVKGLQKFCKPLDKIKKTG
jgi:hypothetical protein